MESWALPAGVAWLMGRAAASAVLRGWPPHRLGRRSDRCGERHWTACARSAMRTELVMGRHRGERPLCQGGCRMLSSRRPTRCELLGAACFLRRGQLMLASSCATLGWLRPANSAAMTAARYSDGSKGDDGVVDGVIDGGRMT